MLFQERSPHKCPYLWGGIKRRNTLHSVQKIGILANILWSWVVLAIFGYNVHTYISVTGADLALKKILFLRAPTYSYAVRVEAREQTAMVNPFWYLTPVRRCHRPDPGTQLAHLAVGEQWFRESFWDARLFKTCAMPRHATATARSKIEAWTTYACTPTSSVGLEWRFWDRVVTYFSITCCRSFEKSDFPESSAKKRTAYKHHL